MQFLGDDVAILVNEGSIVLLLPHIAASINSDFDDDHDSPKGEVNGNVFVNCNHISDIFKHSVDEKGVSSCLKSLRKSRLCKFPCTY